MKKVIAVFDFDKTITTKDSFENLLIYTFGKKRFWTNILKNFFFIAFYAIGLIQNDYLKQKIFKSYFKGITYLQFKNMCFNYSQKALVKIIKDEAIKKIRWHQLNGHLVIIITASMSEWIKPWAETIEIDKVFATEVELQGGILTGNFKGKNCYGQEKLERFLKEFPNREEYTLYAYGDSKGDKPLLDYADFSYYRCFN